MGGMGRMTTKPQTTATVSDPAGGIGDHVMHYLDDHKTIN